MTAPRYPAIVQTIGGVAKTLARVRAFTLEPTGNEAVDRSLRGLMDQIRPLLANHKADFTTVRDVSFTAATATAIAHKLGRAYQGWAVVRVRGAGATFFETANSLASLDAQQVILTASATCTADVEVW